MCTHVQLFVLHCTTTWRQPRLSRGFVDAFRQTQRHTYKEIDLKQERIQYVIQRPMPSFTFYYLQPKDINLWYILLPKAKLSMFSVLALAFLPIFWFYNFFYNIHAFRVGIAGIIDLRVVNNP
jgi:hypothetical protein